MPRFLDTETLFRDRVDAGQRLAKRLESYRHASPVVFAIPRGGVPVGAEIARSLDAELDVVVARKLGAPFHAELAIGAVTADGERFLSQDIISQLRVDDAYLEQITKEQGEEARGGSSGFAGAAHRWTSKAEPPCWWTMDSRRGLRCVRLPAPSASASPPVGRGGSGGLPGSVRGPPQGCRRGGVPRRAGSLLRNWAVLRTLRAGRRCGGPTPSRAAHHRPTLKHRNSPWPWANRDLEAIPIRGVTKATNELLPTPARNRRLEA